MGSSKDHRPIFPAFRISGSAQLCRELQGFDLPPLGMSQEPYAVIWDRVQQIPIKREREQTQDDYAACLAEILDARIDRQLRTATDDWQPEWEIRLPNKLLFGAMQLAKRVCRPSILAKSLQKLWKREQVEPPLFRSDLRFALIDAMMENQTNGQHLKTWKSALTKNHAGSDYCYVSNHYARQGVLRASEVELCRSFRALTPESSTEDKTSVGQALLWHYRVRGRNEFWRFLTTFVNELSPARSIQMIIELIDLCSWPARSVPGWMWLSRCKTSAAGGDRIFLGLALYACLPTDCYPSEAVTEVGKFFVTLPKHSVCMDQVEAVYLQAHAAVVQGKSSLQELDEGEQIPALMDLIPLRNNFKSHNREALVLFRSFFRPI